MKVPTPCRRNTGRTSRVAIKGAMRLVSMTRRCAARSPSSRRAKNVVPALFTQTSMRPQRANASSRRCSRSASTVTSVDTTWASPPRKRQRSAVCSRACIRLAASTTRHPASAKARAEARPIPLLAPVTTTTLPVRSASRERIGDCLSGTKNTGPRRRRSQVNHVEPPGNALPAVLPTVRHVGAQ